MTPAPTVDEPDSSPNGTIYSGVFWLAYLANVTLVTANALTFRFAEFVQFLGGTETVAGTIVTAGLVGVLAARFLLGQAIDRYGTRSLWIGCSLLFLAGSGLFLLCEHVTWVVYAARLAYAIGLAGMFTCSIVHIQNQVPATRRTEVIGNLGSSGFVGMVAGAQISDWLFHFAAPGRERFLLLFGATAALAAVYLLIVLAMTRRDVHRRPRLTPPSHTLLFRFWPGNVVLVAMMMGVGITVTTVFLTRYTTHLGLKNAFGTFFTAYAVSAFLFRVNARNWSRTIGRHRMILLGLAGHAAGFLILPLTTQQWHFLLPAVANGFGHALLFPAVVSLGSGAFPREYRGTGTALVLGFVDLGTALFAPLLGSIIDYYDHAGFTQMFAVATLTVLSVATLYAFTSARVPDSEAVRPVEGAVPPMQPLPVTASTIDVAGNGSAQAAQHREVTRCS